MNFGVFENKPINFVVVVVIFMIIVVVVQVVVIVVVVIDGYRNLILNICNKKFG